MEHQKSTGKSGKVVLILDNAPSHPKKEELDAINSNFEILYLPPNVTAIVQPMDQGAISLTKKCYKKNLLRSALFYHGGTVSYLKQINLCDCFINLKRAWESLQVSTLSKMWKPLLGESYIVNEEASLTTLPSTSNEESVNNAANEPETVFDEIFSQFCQNLAETEHPVQETEKLVSKWYDEDDADIGWGPLTDDEIVNLITNRQVEDVDVSSNDENENNTEFAQTDQFSASEALKCITRLKKYALHATNLSPYYEVLQEIENVIEKEESLS